MSSDKFFKGKVQKDMEEENEALEEIDIGSPIASTTSDEYIVTTDDEVQKINYGTNHILIINIRIVLAKYWQVIKRLEVPHFLICFMAFAGKKELISTIEYQKEKITKYEAKLSDLVRAYKSLAKEKDALQASLAALSSKPTPPVNEVSKKQAQDGEGSENVPWTGNQHTEETQSNEKSSLESKIDTLTSTLRTVSEEKNKLEISTKAERKRILDQKKQIELEFKSEAEEWAKAKKDYETKLQELRSKIIVSQHEREKEATNGIVMLREVESRLSKERNEKEKLEKLLEETQEQNRRFALALGTRNQEKKQQKQIIDLQNELEQVRCRLKKAEDQCKEPPMMKILQDQMGQMKLQYMEAIHQERKRAEAAESSARQLSQTHEERVAALESNLAELSLTAASHDRSEQTYIETIHSLKEKVAELSEENFALSSQQKGSARLNVDTNKEQDPNTLSSTFISLWNQLCALEAASSNKQCNVEELLSNSDIIHRRCLEDYKKLEMEFEELKIKYEKKNDGSSCQCGLKLLTEELRERIRSINASAQTTQALHEEQVTSLREELKKVRKEHEEHLNHLEQDHKVIVANLEQQLAEHCQRSLITLQDRDEEIHRLSKDIYKLNREAQVQPSTVAAALLSQVNSGGSDGPLLHHLEDLARKELEVNKLRKEKIVLEKSMRDIQMSMIEKQQTMQDTIDDLREEVDRLKRNKSRKGENLEYLKNVVLQYMTSTDAESRQLILKAIAAVLKFTPEETESVRESLALWWWQAPPKGKGHSHRLARRLSVAGGGSGTDLGGAPSKPSRSRFLSQNE